MKKRSSRKQKQIDSQITLALLLSAFVTFKWTNSISQTVVILMLFSILVVIILMFLKYKKDQILRNSGIKEIDKMDGVRFEYYLKQLYTSMGYSVKMTKTVGDFGADLILTKGDRKIVVQAKRYKSNVGVKAVQEINSARSHYKADEPWVVTNSYFTNAAIQLAKSNNVKLVDRDQLIQMILSKKAG